MYVYIIVTNYSRQTVLCCHRIPAVWSSRLDNNDCIVIHVGSDHCMSHDYLDCRPRLVVRPAGTSCHRATGMVHDSFSQWFSDIHVSSYAPITEPTFMYIYRHVIWLRIYNCNIKVTWTQWYYNVLMNSIYICMHPYHIKFVLNWVNQ